MCLELNWSQRFFLIFFSTRDNEERVARASRVTFADSRLSHTEKKNQEKPLRLGCLELD